jgi:CheY-like chemotaxis protein
MDNASILIVEDDPFAVHLLREIFRKDKIQFIDKRDGVEASEFLDKHPNEVDLIIMDIVMPKQDGITTTKMIRKNNFKLPIIAISADPTDHNKNRCLKAGCNTFLTKPINIEHLIHTVKKYIPVQA